jgi:AcrR family transcriptional regulator
MIRTRILILFLPRISMAVKPAADLQWVRPPQQARSQETLDRILDAAEALVGEKGFEDSPVAEIVRRAGSSVGAFYTRFGDKDALLHALAARFTEQGMATADEALAPARWQGATLAEILHAVLAFLVSIYRERSGLMRAFVTRNHVDPEFAARTDRLSHYVNDRVASLLLARLDEIRNPDPERAVRFGLEMVFATLESVMLFDELRSSGVRMSDDELSAELARAYLAYLGADDIPA